MADHRGVRLHCIIRAPSHHDTRGDPRDSIHPHITPPRSTPDAAPCRAPFPSLSSPASLHIPSEDGICKEVKARRMVAFGLGMPRAAAVARRVDGTGIDQCVGTAPSGPCHYERLTGSPARHEYEVDSCGTMAKGRKPKPNGHQADLAVDVVRGHDPSSRNGGIFLNHRNTPSICSAAALSCLQPAGS